MPSNKKTLDKISKCSKRLSRIFGENVLFISNNPDYDLGESSAICLIRKDGNGDNTGVFAIRRLLNELKYHLSNEGIKFTFQIEKGDK